MKDREAVGAFLNDLVDVCKKHNLSLAHEDGHGEFLVELYDAVNIDWLLVARDNTRRRRGPVK